MNNKKWLIIILLICILVGIILFKFKNDATTTPPGGSAGLVGEEIEPDFSEVTEEEAAEEERQPVSVTIVGPEEETFSPRQARMWEAQIDNFVSDFGRLGVCKWRFYLNENNQEVLYREQDIRVVLSTDGDNSCAFTSTFIEKQGKLRAEVTVQVMDMQENILETFVGERSYTVL